MNEWINANPVNPYLSQKKDKEIKSEVTQLMLSLSQLPINSETIDIITPHLRQVAKTSARAQKVIVDTCNTLKCDKDFKLDIRSSVNLIYPTKI